MSFFSTMFAFILVAAPNGLEFSKIKIVDGDSYVISTTYIDQASLQLLLSKTEKRPEIQNFAVINGACAIASLVAIKDFMNLGDGPNYKSKAPEKYSGNPANFGLIIRDLPTVCIVAIFLIQDKENRWHLTKGGTATFQIRKSDYSIECSSKGLFPEGLNGQVVLHGKVCGEH
jgi:hypothetical protein